MGRPSQPLHLAARTVTPRILPREVPAQPASARRRKPTARGHASAAASGRYASGPRVVEERVPRAGIRCESRTSCPRRRGCAAAPRRRPCGMRPSSSPNRSEVGTREPRSQVERARRLAIVALGVAQHAVPRHAGVDPGHAARRHERVLPAQAESGDADPRAGGLRPRPEVGHRGSRGRPAPADRAAAGSSASRPPCPAARAHPRGCRDRRRGRRSPPRRSGGPRRDSARSSPRTSGIRTSPGCGPDSPAAPRRPSTCRRPRSIRHVLAAHPRPPPSSAGHPRQRRAGRSPPGSRRRPSRRTGRAARRAGPPPARRGRRPRTGRRRAASARVASPDEVEGVTEDRGVGLLGADDRRVDDGVEQRRAGPRARSRPRPCRPSC